jgi:hypothetical protein
MITSFVIYKLKIILVNYSALDFLVGCVSCQDGFMYVMSMA